MTNFFMWLTHTPEGGVTLFCLTLLAIIVAIDVARFFGVKP
jgi:hypothetical protein